MPHPALAHPLINVLVSIFLGAAGGAAGAAVVASAKKNDAPQPASLPAKVSGSDGSDQLAGPVDPTCDWRRVKNSDLDPFVVGKYRGQLKTEVGTHFVFEHKGKWWLLETVSKESDPDFTTHDKDVRGWIRIKKAPLKTASAEASPATEMVATAEQDSVNDPSLLSGAGYKRMLISDGKVITAVDDLGRGPSNLSGEEPIDDDLGALPVKIVQEGNWGINLREVPDGKFGIPVKIQTSSPPSAPPEATNSQKSSPPATPPAASSSATTTQKTTSGPPSTPPKTTTSKKS